MHKYVHVTAEFYFLKREIEVEAKNNFAQRMFIFNLALINGFKN